MARKPRTDGKPPRSKREDKGTHPAVTKVPAEGNSGGRPNLVIDETTLYQLALTHASYDHMGVILGVSGQFLNAHPGYREIIEKARAEKKRQLLAAQLDSAITDRNPTMMIWMGKQLLEQRDVQRVEQTGPDGGPQQLEHAFKAVAYFPANNRNRQLPSGSARIITEGGEEPIDAELISPDDDDQEEIIVAPKRRRVS